MAKMTANATIRRSWFNRPVACACIFGAVSILSLFFLFNGESSGNMPDDPAFMITQRHYGVDAREMERTVAIPLEDTFSVITGVSSIITCSENSQVRCYIRFRQGVKNQRSYDAVREVAQRVYESLPPSAQRPEITSSNESGIPVWIAALWGFPTGDFLERIVKPVFECIDGIADVEISGTGISENIIAPDAEMMAALGLNPAAIASNLGMNDGFFPAGVIRSDEYDIPVTVDNRYMDTDSLAQALLYTDSGVIRLKDIARIFETEREGDSLSRLNGNRTAIISITPASGSNLSVLSRRINEKMNELSGHDLEFMVLQDKGADEQKAFHSVLIAALISSTVVAITALFLIRKKDGSIFPGLICAACIPFISVISAAFLFRFGFPLDRKLLAGLSIGIGAAADAVLICANGFTGLHLFAQAQSSAKEKKILAAISVPLVTSAATTVAALFPLASFSQAEDTSSIAWALGTVTVVSLMASLVFLPPLLIWADMPVTAGNSKQWPAISAIRRKLCRFLAITIRFCYAKTVLIPAAAVLITLLAVILLFYAGTDISYLQAEDSVYARVEFEGGFRKEDGDVRLASWAADMKEHEGILAVQTSARTGSGQILVNFDPRKIKSSQVISLIRSQRIPGGFVYIPEPSIDDRIWEIKVFGEDDAVCRELAEKAAGLCSAIPLIREVVLNFKDGSPQFMLFPKRELLAEAGVSFSAAADVIRRGIYGPVIYKRINEYGETDVRLKLIDSDVNETPSPDDIMHIYLALNNNRNIRLDSLMIGKREGEPSVIRREDRRRTASFSVRTAVIDPRRVREQVAPVFNYLELPPGYVIEFDPEAIRAAESLSGSWFQLVMALIFCYMVMAAANESFLFPLVVLSAVPPSLAFPVIIMTLAGAPMTAVLACSLVAVSGIAVTSSIISANEFRQVKTKAFNNETGFFYNAVRRCLPVLLSTGVTTIAGALPFLFLREGSNGMLRSLSLVTLLGVTASFICSLVLIPSLIILLIKHRPG